jgi:hypothetical protein
MKRSHLAISPLVAIFAVHCASTVDPAPTRDTIVQTSEALCAGAPGLHPGCGTCLPDPASSSPTGGIQTCWIGCEGESYQQACTVTCGLWGQACCNAPVGQQCFGADLECLDGQCVWVIDAR